MGAESRKIHRASGHLDAASKLDMRVQTLFKSKKPPMAVIRELEKMADEMRDLADATRWQVDAARKSPVTTP